MFVGKRLGQAGDTIVEVMVVLAILGLAFAISSATAARALSQSRNAEEHSQALGIIQSQIELLRAGLANSTTGIPPSSGAAFCMTTPVTATPPTISGFTTDLNSDNLSSGEYPTNCRSTSPYYVSIKYTSGTSPYYTIRVRWDGAGGLDRQQESMNYRVFNLAGS